MALCAWFPLTGTLDNQGIDNVSFTTTNASFQNDGKLGKCLKLGYSSNFTVPSLVNAKQISIAYWLKVNTATSSQWKDTIHFQASNGTNTYWCRHELYSNCTLSGWFTDCGGSKSGMSCTVGEWIHYVITMDFSTGISKVYMNGTLFGQGSTINTSYYVTGSNFCLGESGLDLCENDVRIYNHILSPKEVEILARGLVLHYPMTGGGRGQNNLYDFESEASKWTNEGETSLTNYTDDIYGKVLKISGVASKRIYRSVSNVWTTSGGKYTVSFLAKSSVNGATCDMSRSLVDYAPTFTLTTGWKKYTGVITLTGTSSAGTLSFRTLTTADYYITQIKLEVGEIATTYIPGVGDSHYNAMGYNDNIEYDVSGYLHNGTINGSTSYSSDTARYSTSTYFENDTKTISSQITIGDDSAITMSCWVRSKNGTQGKGGYQMPLNINAAPYEFSIPSNGKFRQGFYINGTRYVNDYGSTNLLDKNWHMISATYDGTNIKRYVDGVLVNTTAVTGKLATGVLNLLIGKYYGSSNYGNVELYESDIRIYATALSATQIAELYNTAVSLSNNGTLMGYELIEN